MNVNEELENFTRQHSKERRRKRPQYSSSSGDNICPTTLHSKKYESKRLQTNSPPTILRQSGDTDDSLICDYSSYQGVESIQSAQIIPQCHSRPISLTIDTKEYDQQFSSETVTGHPCLDSNFLPGSTPLSDQVHFREQDSTINNIRTPSRFRTSSHTSFDTVESFENCLSPNDDRLQSVFRPISRKKVESPIMYAQSTSSSSESIKSKSPLPQNLRGDPFRSAKVKTELCRNFMSGKGCPFGSKCNYAHGEHELKFTKLLDLERSGLVDIEIFRTHPCFTWVATGACPFDQRCMSLHDPRVEGTCISWLPHAETSLNSMGSNVIVDSFFHQRLSSIYSCSPILGYVPKRMWKNDPNEVDYAWNQFYNFICNTTRKQESAQRNINFLLGNGCIEEDTHNRLADYLNEVHVLEMVLKMRERRLGQSYTYLPSHLFCGELCMVLQSKQFQLISLKENNVGMTYGINEVVESDVLTNANSRRKLKQFTAYEIAFGPLGDPSVKSLSIWFDLSPTVIIPCTSQQAKRHKRSRHRLKRMLNKQSKEPLPSTNLSELDEDPKGLESIQAPHFYENQPHDNIAFDLVTDILNHRLGELKHLSSDNAPPSCHVKQKVNEFKKEEKRCKSIFGSLCRFWLTYSWPAMNFCGIIDNETDVPPVNGKYNCTVGVYSLQSETFFGVNNVHLQDLVSSRLGYFPAFLWKSFISNILLDKGKDVNYIKQKSKCLYDVPFSSLNRLNIFRHLSKGGEVNVKRDLQHLNQTLTDFCSREKQGENTLINRTEITIESLFDEWKSVEAHFEKSYNTLQRMPEGQHNT